MPEAPLHYMLNNYYNYESPEYVYLSQVKCYNLVIPYYRSS